MSVPPSHPSQHLPVLPRNPSVSTNFLLPLSLCTFFSIYGNPWGVFNGFQGHHAQFCSHYCSMDHAQPSSRVHHVSWCWCRGAHARPWWPGGTTLADTSCRWNYNSTRNSCRMLLKGVQLCEVQWDFCDLLCILITPQKPAGGERFGLLAPLRLPESGN